jgi:RNA polymerase sigma-70 factor (ECF subfamily)
LLSQIRNPENNRAGFEALCGRYWKPVYAYVRLQWGYGNEDSKDLTQQFFAKLLEPDRLDALSPERGSLRGFLKVALRNFLANADRDTRARPRFLQLDGAHEQIADEAALSPEEAFDRAWAKDVLKEAVDHLRREQRARRNNTGSRRCNRQRQAR